MKKRITKSSEGSRAVYSELPRVRDCEEKFESQVLPLFRRRRAEVGQLLPELYLHGLAKGGFELALRGLLGEGAPLRMGLIGVNRGHSNLWAV
jgi:hypothetical protein